MRKLILALPLFALASCATGGTSGTTGSLTAIEQLAVGDAFTVAQGAAQAYVAAHPTSAAGVQALLTAAQQAFLAWVNAPAGSTGTTQAALQAAVNSLLTSLATQGVKF